MDVNSYYIIKIEECQSQMESNGNIELNSQIQPNLTFEKSSNTQLEKSLNTNTTNLNNLQMKSPKNDETITTVYQMIYPEDFNLKRKIAVKRGRPKLKKPPPALVEINETSLVLPIMSKTRSGRAVKIPSHIKQDLTHLTPNRHSSNETSHSEKTSVETPIITRKKRVIRAQYKCPKCEKTYLGKGRFLQHIFEHPDHGPVVQGTQNCQLWNHLIDISNSSSPGQKGHTFCEELKLFFNNLQTLKNSLFESTNGNKNVVYLDESLSSILGLTPGKYKFNESQLFKDVRLVDFLQDNKKTIQSSPDNLNDLSPKSTNDLILPEIINESSNLLDEVINVDQFVNERFTNITETPIDHSSMNLDLQNLDLFEFNTS